jgi:signal transduction histidine kinase/ActR/RegA family two-component response regulator
VIWAGYAWSFFIRDDATANVPDFLQTLRTYNSFIDVLLQTTLALAMIITIFLDLEREAEVARHERLRMQERLAHSQKLEALGGVVSGVAHELNNPLTAILGFSEEMRRLHPEGDAAECARVVHEQAERCRAIVRDLLTFARSRAAERVAVDTSELIARVVRGFDPEMRRRALDFELESDASLPSLLAEPAALEQVFANLIANAIHASPDGGRIRVSARPAGRSAEFWIEDEGPGVPRTLRDRIFEPFFTTKAPGQGTGLGLSVTHGIVMAHGGTIRCDDRADGRPGARFVVALPVEGPDAKTKTKRLSKSDLAAAASPTPPGSQAASASSAPAATPASPRPPRVLVADDEESVRRLLVRRVKQRGFEAIEASSGRTALQQIADHPDLDVIVTDLKMPDTSGFELLEWLSAHLSGLLERTIVISGDVQSAAVAKVTRRFRCSIFEKPLDLDAVVAKIEALAGPRAATQAPAQATKIA